MAADFEAADDGSARSRRGCGGGAGEDGVLAIDLLGAKGLGLLRWSSRRTLCMPDEQERGGIAMGSENRGGADRIEEETQKICGGMDRAEREERRKARKQRRVWGLRARGGERRI